MYVRCVRLPSRDTKSVEAVHWAFDAICRGGSIESVARELNRRGLRTVYGNPFNFNSVRGLLVNPAYAGVLRVGMKKTRAKFVPLTDEMVVVEDAHEPLVTMEQFERAQKMLASRQGTPPTQRHSLYILAGIVVCGHCGIRMHGKYTKGRHRSPDKYFYQCYQRKRPKNAKPCDTIPCIPGDLLEQAVLDTIRSQVLSAKGQPKIRDAIIRATQVGQSKTGRQERKLETLRQKIDRGTENLALATEEDFAGIAKLLSKWQEEEARLTLEISRQVENLQAVPEAMEILSNMDLVRENVDAGNRQVLRSALRQTIDRIEVRKEYVPYGGLFLKELTAVIHFNRLILGGKKVVLPSRLFVKEAGWQRIAKFARGRKEPVRIDDVVELLGCPSRSLACHHLNRAVKAGVLRHLPGPESGWVATD